MKTENSTSLQIFLSRIVDYAGLYPPASLSLEDAIRNFVKYQGAPEVWMLSRFIIPARKLSELSKQSEQVFPKKAGLSFSALGRGGKAAADFAENLETDIAEISAFRELHGTGVLIDVFEITLPASELASQLNCNEIVNMTADSLNKNGLTVYFEAPSGESWHTHAEKLIRALRKFKDKHVGLKLRTGGVTKDAFPTPQEIAWSIALARDAGIPMKATAGLHHPIRHHNDGVKAKMHGFLNVFGAGVLALSHGLDQNQIQAIIEDEEPLNFIFDEAGFSWKNFTANNDQIAQARASAVVSFGSCSFDEPREDLHKLGFLDR